MAKEQRKSDKPNRDKKGGSGKLIGRIVVYSVLAILLVVGLLDYRVKSAAVDTGTAWRAARRNTPETEDLLRSQLKQYIKGDPKTETRAPGAEDGPLVASVVRYSWKGIVRTYVIDVALGLGKDPPVEAITGP